MKIVIVPSIIQIFAAVSLVFCSSAQAGDAQKEEDKPFVQWTLLDSYETTKTTKTYQPVEAEKPGPDNYDKPVVSHDEFQNWLCHKGVIDKDTKIEEVHEPQMIPTEAGRHGWHYESSVEQAIGIWETENDFHKDAEKLLDKLDADPDKDRDMPDTGYTYSTWLGDDWLKKPRKNRVALLCKEIEEKQKFYRAIRDVTWYEIEGNIVGVSCFPWDGPLATKVLTDVMACRKYPVAMSDEVIAGKWCVTLETLPCRNVYFQTGAMQGSDVEYNFKPVGVANNWLLLRAHDRLFAYSKQDKRFVWQVLMKDLSKKEDQSEHYQMCIFRGIPYLVVVEEPLSKKGKTKCTLWRGTWDFPPVAEAKATPN